ncbi:unnamed protein product [Acanthoscelides obtectus]|uniref:DDE Tnp4 domain-containing protein n=1 Tax=Acanthoscelides obtectus TaxID=200917 RepID=A0A9P0Q587_ACAOB|nr:unnamed protein product [Acanthoscelides obtectus]CAK1641139.1 hypothetical protein AOBTE_LOCUS12188 [Acanthoscelides obtectus]
MVPGDMILADKGFLIKALLPAGVPLNIPPFLTTPQFTESQVYETANCKSQNSCRTSHQKNKMLYFAAGSTLLYISQISVVFQLCAALTNFQYPLIKEVEEYY